MLLLRQAILGFDLHHFKGEVKHNYNISYT